MTTPQSKHSIKRTWWKESTVYQIYPASFKDSNGDGWGDLQGVISKLDYIKNLGVDIVWLSPILKSPQQDMGYDISDYRNIDTLYGDMDDHDALIKGLHERGLKYVLDLVVNHSSDQHPWFQQSRLSKDNPYRDWYIWRPAKYDEDGTRMPPNNWESAFSGSVWEWDETTQEYYLHLFAKGQPDLNWENPKVVAAVHEIIRFWLDRGVDGFRMDVINFISKEPGLPDGKITKPGFLQSGVEHFACGPRLHEYLKGIGEILREYDAFSVGEMPGVHDKNEILKGVGQDRGELAMAFNFEIVDLDHAPGSKWIPRQFEVKSLKQVVHKWQTFMLANGGWNAIYLENHDQSRTVSRYCSDSEEYRTISAKMLASHLGFQSGTLFVFQGQEWAQANVPRDWPLDKYKDIEVRNHWDEIMRKYPDDKELQERTKKQFWLIGRDNARTPVQWVGTEPYAGFTTENPSKKPWMDVHPDFRIWNAENAVADPDSAFHYWKKLLALRKKEKDTMIYGSFEMLDIDDDDVAAYVRTADSGRRALIIGNWKEKELWWPVPSPQADLLIDDGKLNDTTVLTEFRNYKDTNKVKVEDGKSFVQLRPFETIVALG
ncbi:hypothetical protein H2198_000985 [Neophaeococcomyces mojaviensis]|uniref:Uncharacterized protein n=1 Tax=Neophaeococcomyces mojaviensis TaxID=3383035 RepID=A0ACC3AII1_9EURO|nr:hypothetical protein H2198_000985 [Knufia sp. JES_112]